MNEFDLDFNMGFEFDMSLGRLDEGTTSGHAQAAKTINKHIYSRFTSERILEEKLDWEFKPGECLHVISMGDIDSFSYLKFILRQQALIYCLLSTWCMSLTDVNELERYLRIGRIKRLDCYVGEIFKNSYTEEYARLCAVMREFNGRVCIFRNHSKIYAGFGEKFDFVVESSANINTNPRCENTVITIDSGLARFYKDFFDGINSFERNFDEWGKYELKAGEVNGEHTELNSAK